MRYGLSLVVFACVQATATYAQIDCDVTLPGHCADGSDISGYTTVCRTIALECNGSDCSSSLDPPCDEPKLAVDLLITAPGAGPKRGVIVFGSGGLGQTYYEDAFPGSVEDLLEPLLADGYVVIQRKWKNTWWNGVGGLRSTSRRGARMYEWLAASTGTGSEYGDFPKLDDLTFVVTGNSGGADEVVSALAFHALEGTIDGAVATSGPPRADLQRGCWGDDVNAFDPVWFDDTPCLRDDSPAQDDAKALIGDGYCFDRDGDGCQYEDTAGEDPCSSGCGVCDTDPGECTGTFPYEAYQGVLSPLNEERVDFSYGPDADTCVPATDPLECPCQDAALTDADFDAQQDQLCYDSLICDSDLGNDEPDYDYTATRVAFLYGEEDCGPIPLPLLFATTVTHTQNSVGASITFVSGAPHELPDDSAGATAILGALRYVSNACVGDANMDGVVNGDTPNTADVDRIDDNLGCTVGDGDLQCDASDVDGDGDVDCCDKECARDNDGLCVNTACDPCTPPCT